MGNKARLDRVAGVAAASATEVVEAAAVTRVWASQTTQCYAELHSVGITDYTALHSVTQCGQRASAAERTGSVHLRALLHLFPVLASDFHRSRLVSLSFCLSVSQ